ncbi:helix-turn-helix domain-containing protein [Marinobacter adhaerens]|uniref:helix-turn-helix domain-containing protein n=2 Tax=Marinobacter adhaerens TaxID=1033846 RepID=UPI003BACBFAB
MEIKGLGVTMTRQSSDTGEVNVQREKVDAFSERVAIAIKKAGGATLMAQKAEVSGSVLRKWRSGQSDPSRTNLVKMARAAGVSLEWLATGEGDPEGKAQAHKESPEPEFELDLENLEEVAAKVLAMLEKHRPDISARAKARILRLVYEFYLRQGEPMDEASLNNVIELAAFRY